MQFRGEFTRGGSPTHDQKGQESLSFGGRDGGNGRLFKGINNVRSNGSRMGQLFQKENTLRGVMLNRFNPKRIGLDAHGNDELVVFDRKGVVMDRFAMDQFVFRIQGLGPGMDKGSLGAQNGTNRFLNAATFQGAH